MNRKTHFPEVTFFISVLILLSSLSNARADLRYNGEVFRIDRMMSQAAGQRFYQGPVLIAAEKRITRNWINGLRDQGIHLEGYIPDDGYLASIPREMDIRGLPGVMAIFPISPYQKIHPDVMLARKGGNVNLVLHFFLDSDPEVVSDAVQHLGMEYSIVRRPGVFRVVVKCPEDLVGEVTGYLAKMDMVYFIERGRGARLLNSVNVPLLQSGLHDGPFPIWERGIFGEGEIIAVCDTGIDADACFFADPSGTLPPVNDTAGIIVEATRRKVIAVNFLDPGENPSDPKHWDNHGHGTAVSGCALGSDIANPVSAAAHAGMAPFAKLVMQDAGYQVDDCADLPGLGCPVIDLAGVFLQTYLQGARIHNNSWGDREEFLPHNTYTSAARDMDAFTREYRDFLGVFAGGNDGDVSGAVGSPGTAKNALSVGGTRRGAEGYRMAPFSSRGPASDGRLKPDLCAPAYAVTASSNRDVSISNCGTTSSAGTSFASPYAAGCAALVREYLRRGFWRDGAPNPASALSNPSAALIKAMLVNSCVDVSEAEPVPARDQGWGRIVLKEVLRFSEDSQSLWVMDEIHPFFSEEASPVTISVNLAEGGSLKATLVWTDYPATPGADSHLVNDLDLEVLVGDETYRGNFFSGGRSIPGGTADRRNNIEQVWLENLPEGTVSIRVSAHRIPEPPQDFAWVLRGNFSIIETGDLSIWRVY